MAGTLSADYIQPQSNTGLTILTPAGGTIASVNIGGIYSATGNLLISSSFNGLVANTGISGLIINAQLAGSITSDKITSVSNTAIVGLLYSEQIANVANTKITGTITNNVNSNLVRANSISLSNTGITFVDGSSQNTASIGSPVQSWQDVKASRAFGTTYTNSTGRPIMVSVAVASNGSQFDAFLTITVDGVNALTTGPNSGATGIGAVYGGGAVIVPNGSTYSATRGTYGATVGVWSELR